VGLRSHGGRADHHFHGDNRRCRPTGSRGKLLGLREEPYFEPGR